MYAEAAQASKSVELLQKNTKEQNITSKFLINFRNIALERYPLYFLPFFLSNLQIQT